METVLNLSACRKLFVSSIIFVLCSFALTGKAYNENKLIECWQDFVTKYKIAAPERKFCIDQLTLLERQIELLKESDNYSLEKDESNSKIQESIDLLLFHTHEALTGAKINDFDNYSKECTLLIASMNSFILFSMESDHETSLIFVELLTIISFLCIVLVLAGASFLKNRNSIVSLAEKNKEEKLLTKTIVQVQENERNRIARDLHDTVIQNTRLVLLFARELESLEIFQKAHEGRGLDLIQKIKKLEEQNMRDIRDIIRNLTPPELANTHISKLISEHMQNIIADGIKLKLYVETSESFRELEKSLATEQKLHIFRIIQESVNNAIKHSNADEISVIVRSETKALVFVVSDNGCGIKNSTIQKNKERQVDTIATGTHLGLYGMKSHAAILNADFSIKSTEDTGTQVLLKVPVKIITG